MTAPERFEQDLPQLLAQLAAGPRPDYRDSLVEAVARTPQRRAWTFPGRWLPVDIATAPVRPVPTPMRAVILAALLLLALAAALLVVAGSRPRLPEPFGPARNGLVVYGSGGDLYAMEADGTKVRPLVEDPAAFDSDPLFSPLGDRLVFAREVDKAWELWIVNPDGSGLRKLTERLLALGPYAWSPDGRQIAAEHSINGMSHVTIVDVDGGGRHELDLPFPAGEMQWRPGHDGQLLVRSLGQDVRHLYLVDLATGTPTKLELPRGNGPVAMYDTQRAAWSPDGTRLLVEEGPDRYSPAGRPIIRLRLADIAADGTVTASRLLEHDPGADYEYGAEWLTSGDGFVFNMQAGCRFGVFAVTGDDIANARPIGKQIDDCTNRGVDVETSPDGTHAITQRTGPEGTPDEIWITGIDGSGLTPVGTTTDLPTWQRLAP